MRYLIIGLLMVGCTGAYKSTPKSTFKPSCKPTIRSNQTKEKWNQRDEDALLAQIKFKRCEVNVPGNPCLRVFYKLGKGKYHCWCSKKSK